MLVAAILLASSVVAEPAIQEFGDWRLHADAPRPYLAYEPAPGSSLRIYCQEIDGYPTPPYVRTAYFLSANLVVRNADRYRNQPSVTVTYAIGENGERMSDEWRRPLLREKAPAIEAMLVHAEAVIARMRQARGHFEFEALGQRLSPSLDRFDAAISALDGHCARRG